MSTTTLMTVEEFARMSTPETVDFELVEGELIPLSSGTPLHAKPRFATTLSANWEIISRCTPSASCSAKSIA